MSNLNYLYRLRIYLDGIHNIRITNVDISIKKINLSQFAFDYAMSYINTDMY